MIMRPGQQLLLPANPVFIWLSMILAFVANIMLNFLANGQLPWAPDVLSVVLVFWTIHQPQRVGIAAAFVFGLLMDVHEASLLGQHALAYSVLSFLAIAVHRRLLWFSLPSQAVQVLPLFAMAHVMMTVLRVSLSQGHPSWWIVLAPLLESLLWLPLTVFLLAPQRRAPDPDANRPL
ncbi:rod shape-determining protein MreD [Curvibacter sp. CHRR-16]|uniref:rod shape-determining protein MreD n=1 Tax=Curvibacter sp. CHRR-16 TaxID=2835872 RepID=UPI001BDAD5FD|nr:rod shape-determining protein MreD [Curvibacter sp. CHRR-16]MBT0570058.1 rod shape-determining protein MreD [Curvibacter sp. CHRR-16]